MSSSNRLSEKAKKADKSLKLREFARTSDNEQVQELAARCFFNKTANTKKDSLGLGSTRKKKGR